MKLLARIVIISIIFVVCGSAELPMVGGDIGVRSKYVWRGAVFNSEPVLWPDIWATWHGFTFCTWSSLDLTDVKQKQFSITDLAFFFDYTHKFGFVTPTAGFVLYTYPGSAYGPAFPTTGEMYAKIMPDLKFAQASLNINYDVIKAKGLYISPSLTKGLSFGNLALNLTLSCGFADGKHNNYYYGLDKICFTDFTAVLKFNLTPPGALANWLTLSADIDFSMLIDSELADLVESYGDAKNIYGGAGISIYYQFGGE